MKYSTEELGMNIKKERQRLGLSQSNLGKELAVTGKQISEYESGRVIPPLEKLFRLCEVFKCELGHLLGEEDYEKGTRAETFVCKYLGLSVQTVRQIRRITGKSSKTNLTAIEDEYFKKTEALNKIVGNGCFSKVAEELWELDEQYHKWKDSRIIIQLKMTCLEKEEPDQFKAAFKFIDAPDQYKEEKKMDPNLTVIVQEIEDIIGEMHAADQCYENDIKYCRFKVQEAITTLLNDIYPYDTR